LKDLSGYLKRRKISFERVRREGFLIKSILSLHLPYKGPPRFFYHPTQDNGINYPPTIELTIVTIELSIVTIVTIAIEIVIDSDDS
jgi:hypothetical protein